MNKQEIEKAIEQFKVDISYHESIIARNTEYPEYCKKERLYIDTLNLMISTLTQQLNNGWIPVLSDIYPELPKEWVDDGFNRIAVLATSEYEDMAVIRWYDIEDKAFYDDFDSLAGRDLGVEAWMYLPKPYEPYKEVSE